jgi:hypothetical protein
VPPDDSSPTRRRYAARRTALPCTTGHDTNGTRHTTNDTSHDTNGTNHDTNDTGHEPNGTNHGTNGTNHGTNGTSHDTNGTGHGMEPDTYRDADNSGHGTCPTPTAAPPRSLRIKEPPTAARTRQTLTGSPQASIIRKLALSRPMLSGTGVPGP